MYYHVLVEMGLSKHGWVNLEYHELVKEVVAPFINKQVVPVNHNRGRAIINLSNANYLRVYKTDETITNETPESVKVLTSTEFQECDCTQEIIDQFLVTKSPIETKSLLQNLFMPKKAQVFVIMKFKDKALDSAYEGVIRPIVKRFKYVPLRIDEVQDSGRISDQILEEIVRSEIVLADLTGERPNCYYEAGFAHAIGKEIIFTMHKGSSIHFDLAGHRFIEWETEEELRRELQKRFKAIQKRQVR